MSIRRCLSVALTVAAAVVCGAARPAAADQIVVSPAYRTYYHTVYDVQEVTAYRIEYETVYEEREVTVTRPVLETQIRERRYRVARPVYETAEREERYTVRRPVWETEYRTRSYDRIREVVETSHREERYQVARPGWETHNRERRYIVRRPVVETAEREETYTVLDPVVTYRTVQEDHGYYVEQHVCRPGPVYNRLAWQPGGCVVDPVTGVSTYYRGGLYWVPVQGAARLEVQRVWQPQIVERQVPQTTYVRRVETRRVPIQVHRWAEEEVVEQVPERVCRMVTEEHVRSVPVTVRRHVRERVEEQVPLQVCRVAEEQHVRRVPVTTLRYEYEERVDQVPVQVCRYEQVVETVRVPRLVARRVPITYACRVPRVVRECLPCDPGDVWYEGAPLGAPQDETYDPGTYDADAPQQGPTPADETDGERTDQPRLDPEEAVPGPVDEDAGDA